MPGFSLDAAHSSLKETLANLLNEPISRKEIDQARQEEVASAQSAKRHPAGFLSFLENVAADGFPPVSPSVFADLLINTTDQEVIDFANTVMKPSATFSHSGQKSRLRCKHSSSTLPPPFWWFSACCRRSRCERSSSRHLATRSWFL